MANVDTQTLHSPAWVNFACLDGVGLYLADSTRLGKQHKLCPGVMPQRYLVLTFDTTDVSIIECADCGAPGGHFSRKPKWFEVHYQGDDEAAAKAAFEAAEEELRRVAHG